MTFVTVRRALMAAVLATTVAANPEAQSSWVPCPDRACTPTELWAGAAQLHQLKDRFVVSLRDFLQAAAGAYGDEGPMLLPKLDVAQQVLTVWDQGVATYEAALRATPATADVHAAAGSVYLDRARVADAVREFAEAARMDPTRADVHALSGLAYELQGDEASAAREFKRAATLAPTDLAILYRLSESLERLTSPEAQTVERNLDAAIPFSDATAAGEPALRFDRVNLLRQPAGVAPIFPPEAYVPGFRLLDSGRYADALQSLRDAAMNDPLRATPAASPTALAGATLRQGLWQAAISRLRIAADQDARASEPHRLAGLAYWAGDDEEKSLDALDTAVRLNPDDERARIALADVSIAAMRPADAERALKETASRMPASGQAHDRLAVLYRSESLVPAAIEQFQRALDCAPVIGLDNLYETIGGLYTTQASFDNAIAAYRNRIDANPNNADAHRKLGEIYALVGRDNAALAEFAAARGLNPRDVEARVASGQIYLRTNRNADAERAARSALAIDPQHSKARFTLGTALVRLGHVADGQRELDAYQRSLTDAALAQQHATATNAQRAAAARDLASGDYTAAIAAFRDILASAPEDELALLGLGDALTRHGDLDEARTTLVKAQQVVESADVHRLLAVMYARMGLNAERDREQVLYQQLMERAREDRLKTQPLLR